MRHSKNRHDAYNSRSVTVTDCRSGFNTLQHEPKKVRGLGHGHWHGHGELLYREMHMHGLFLRVPIHYIRQQFFLYRMDVSFFDLFYTSRDSGSV